LSIVETSRAIQRARLDGRASEEQLARVEAEIEALWGRCDLWELTADICQRARTIAPGRRLRALDALHLATFVAARERIDRLELLTVDARLAEASAAVCASSAG
jgi:predicted nucleic acid-binding protein